MLLDLSFLFAIGLIITVATVLAYVSRILKQPLIVGYVIAGILIGPFGFALITGETEILTLSELGVALLLFGVGLEIDFRALKSVGLVSIAGGCVQVLVTFIIGFFIGLSFGLGNIMGIYIGLLLAFSSTMIVTKILVDRNELKTLHGRIMLGVLLVQDILAVIFMPVLDNLYSAVPLQIFLLILIKGLGLFALAILLNKFVFPKILDYAAKTHEIFFLTAISTFFVFMGISYYLGFSIAIGAFIGGLALANFPYNIEIAGEAHALRDFFSIIFFATLGMQMNIWIIQGMLPLFIVLLIAVLLIKPFILNAIYLLLGYGGRTSSYIGLGLGQGSEFMFIIAAQGLVLGQITSDLYSLIISVIVISIMVTPYLMKFRGGYYRFLSRFRHHKIEGYIRPKTINQLEKRPAEKMKNHVIVFGCHRMGGKIVDYLEKSDHKFLVVERDPEIVKNLSKRGIHCFYGDADNTEILNAVDLEDAKLIVLAIPDSDISTFVIRKIRRANPKAIVFSRAATESEANEMCKVGADFVLVPEFITGDEVVRKIKEFLSKK